jgi:hypothetical protein
MKLFIKLMLTLLTIAVVLPFTSIMPGGMPLFKWSDIKMPQIKTPQLPELSGGTPDRGKIQTFYKWKDDNGAVHYSDQPPKENVDGLSTVEVNPDTNLLPAVDTATTQPAAKSEGQKRVAKNDAPSSYSPETIKRLFEDAHKLQEKANQRKKMLDGIEGGDKK